ncbi:unnamed protein product, partial [Meganyctiphanes norvegica]
METHFMTRYPRVVTDMLLLFKIFRWQVWLVIFGTLIFISTCLWAIENWKVENSSFDPYKAFATIFKAFLFQGFEDTPGSTPGRLLVGVFLTSMVVKGYLYSGSLTAFLSAPRFEKVPKSAEEMLELGYTMWIQEVFGPYIIVKNSQSIYVQKLLETAEVSLDESQVLTSEIIQRALTENL